MDAKVSSDFWGDPAIEALDKDQKLAALYAYTSERTNLFGYLEVTPKRFEFETGTPYQALASLPEAHPKGFIAMENGFWIRRFIARQFGTGQPLIRNNFCKAILAELRAYEGLPLFNEVLLEYPELQEKYDDIFYANPELPLGRAPEGLTKPKRREEKRSAEQNGEERSVESAPGSKNPPSSPDSAGQNSSAEKKEKGVAVDPLLYRARSLFWSESRRPLPQTFTLDASETTAWKKNKGAVAETAEDGWLLLEWAYGQTTGDAATYRRKGFATLLNNWNHELTSARDWAKRAGVLGKLAQASTPAPIGPEGWEAAAGELFPGCDTSRGWSFLTPDAQGAVTEFLRRNPTERTQ